jgi:molybdopterin converting factor small subunit
MRITLKLFASLGQFLPAGAKAHAVQVEVPDGASAHQVLEQVHLVLLNGVYLDAQARERSLIKDDDALAAWPPVAGG